MANLDIKLTKIPSKLKVLEHYDIHVDGEFWGKTVDFQTSIDPCWRIYQQRFTGLSYIVRNQTSWHNSGSGKFKDKQEVIDYVESSPTCYKENSNIFIDDSPQPNSIRNTKNSQPQNARHGNTRRNNKKKNFRK